MFSAKGDIIGGANGGQKMMGKHSFPMSPRGKVLEGVLNTSNPISHSSTPKCTLTLTVPCLYLVFPEPFLLLPGIFSQTNFLHPRPCFRLFWEIPHQDKPQAAPKHCPQGAVAPDGESDGDRGKLNTGDTSSDEFQGGVPGPLLGIMEGFLEEGFSTVRPENQEDSGLAKSMCGCRERQRV